MSRESIQQFIQAIMQNPALQEQLEAAPDQESMVNLAVRLGEENGYSFTAEEVNALLAEYTGRPELSYPLEDMIPEGYSY